MSVRDASSGQKLLTESLGKIPFFNLPSEENLQILLEIGNVHDYQSEEIIQPETSSDRHVFVLLKGQVSLKKNEKQLILLKSTGDIFGEIGFISNDRQVSAIAKEPTSCYIIDMSVIETKPFPDKTIIESIFHRFIAETLAGRIKSIQFENIVLHQEVVELRRLGKTAAKNNSSSS